MTNDILSPSAGLFTSLSLEEGGAIPALLKNFGSSLPFSQYYKATAYARWYDDFSTNRFAILAVKLKGGFAEPYRFRIRPGEESLPVPLNRRFFAGGSGSVRGWRARELGTMVNPQLGGDATFEASVESRINVLKGVSDFWWFRLSGIWTVLFFDIGNVWSRVQDVHSRELAVASGFGIRYDTVFGPVRVDLGFRVYDPAQPAGQQWVTSKRFWGETLANGVLHFGIGQAF
jgi:outer membrane protein insertion porin family